MDRQKMWRLELLNGCGDIVFQFPYLNTRRKTRVSDTMPYIPSSLSRVLPREVSFIIHR